MDHENTSPQAVPPDPSDDDDASDLASVSPKLAKNHTKRDDEQRVASENDVERRVVDWALDEGFLPFKLNLQANTGWPDRLWLFAYPFVAFIEFKRPGEEPRPLQEERIKELKDRGYPTGVFSDAEEAIAWLEAKKNAVKRRQVNPSTSMRWAVVEARARKNFRGLHGPSHPSRKKVR